MSFWCAVSLPTVDRGIDICREMVPRWWNRFGPMFAGEIWPQSVARVRGYCHWCRHRDEMYVKGEIMCLWRAVDHEGEALDRFITRTRVKAVALAFMEKALKHQNPSAAVTAGN